MTSGRRLFDGRPRRRFAIAGAPPSRYRFNNRWVCRGMTRIRSAAAEVVSRPHQAAPVHQSDSALACSSAPHPSDPQPPTLTTRREKTDIPTLLSADILALLLH